MLVPPPAPSAPPPARPKRVALVHDWICGYRGGEAVLDAIARALAPDHDLVAVFVMFDDRRPLTPAIDALPHVVSRLGRLPLASTVLRRHLLPLYPLAVGQLSAALARVHAAKNIDLVISTSSAAVKGVRPPYLVPHICYCHAPARYVWSLEAEYARGSLLRRVGLGLFAERFRAWDASTASHVTTFLANSSHTRREIYRCYERDSTILFPPVRTGFFSPDSSVPREEFWLVVSALEPYKRIDLAIHAANAARHPLLIAGTGSERRALERLAGPTVRFLGRVSDDQLRDLYRRARLLLFPQIEDFGIVAAEAQSSGLSVVARRAGGAIDIILEGSTGAFFDEPSPAALLDAVARCPVHNDDACRGNAARFSEEAFAIGLRQCLAPRR
jgi:glycosyltransferase involved in cell wall biosynthesis